MVMFAVKGHWVVPVIDVLFGPGTVAHFIFYNPSTTPVPAPVLFTVAVATVDTVQRFSIILVTRHIEVAVVVILQADHSTGNTDCKKCCH